MNNEVVGFVSRGNLIEIESILIENGVPSEVIGDIWFRFDNQDEEGLYKSITWALTQVK